MIPADVKTLLLESWNFTTTSALAREVKALLECTSYKFVILVRPEHWEELAAEMENWRLLGRVKVEKIKMSHSEHEESDP